MLKVSPFQDNHSMVSLDFWDFSGLKGSLTWTPQGSYRPSLPISRKFADTKAAEEPLSTGHCTSGT